MKITNDSVELHVAEDGDPSAPPILLLHGITSFGGTWDWFVPELAERFRVLRLDFRGHGRSDRAPGEYSPTGYLSDAVAAIEQAAGRPCIVIGHSLGGATAAALAQRHPDLVVAAVMEDPPLGVAGSSAEAAAGDAPALAQDNSLLESFRVIRETAPQMQASGMTSDALAGVLAMAPTSTGASFADTIHPDALAAMAGSLLTVDASVLDPVLTGSIGTFLDPDGPFLVPSLIVCADPAKPDAVADAALAQHYVGISSATEFVVVEGAGHLIHDEQASREAFRQAAIGFIDGVIASGAD